MSDLDLNSKQWCELVFDGKNTEFGAFQMRQGSTSRHNKAMIIVAILVVLIITLPALFRYIDRSNAVGQTAAPGSEE